MSSRRGVRLAAQRLWNSPPTAARPKLGEIERLVVVRESDAHEWILFEDMLHKTVSAFVGSRPELAKLLEWGMRPVHEPATVNAVVQTAPDARSIQFLVGSNLVLYHLGSAARRDSEGALNSFTEAVIDAVCRYRIREICAFHVNRLVRDYAHGKRLSLVLSEAQVMVRTPSMDFDMGTSMGQMMWEMAASYAAAERQGIVERNRLGRIAAARRGCWPHAPDVVPVGYRLEGKTIVPDASQRDGVVLPILVALGDPNLTNRGFIERLGAIGVRRPRLARMLGRETEVTDVRHPKDIRASFEGYLSLYETGVYEMPLPNPSPGAATFGGLPVYRPEAGDDPQRERYPDGFVVLRYEFGLPDGGWAPPEVFDAIRARQAADDRYRTGPRVRPDGRRRKPFSGRPPYTVGDATYQLDSNTAGGYRLRRIEREPIPNPDSAAPSRQRWRITSATTIGTVTTEELHTCVANGIVEVLSRLGAPGAVRADALRVEVTPAQRFATTIEFHRRRAARAREEALRTTDEATAAAFRADAEREEQLAAAAEAARDEAATATPVTPSRVHVDVSKFVRVMARLAGVRTAASGSFCNALATILPGFELRPGPTPGELEWAATVRLPTDDGQVLELGPITGRVTRRSHRKFPSQGTSRRSQVLEGLAAGLTIEQIATQWGHESPAAAVVTARAALMAAEIPGPSVPHLVRAPIPELRIVAARAARTGTVAALRATPDLDAAADLLVAHGVVPADTDPRWAAYALRCYLTPRGSKRWIWTQSTELGQAAIDLAVDRGGTITVADLVANLARRTSNEPVLLDLVLGRREHPAVLQPAASWRTRRGRAGRGNRLMLIPCRHCGADLTRHLRVAELPAALLCESCLHTSTNDVRYPASYLAVERGIRSLPGLPRPRRDGDERAPKRRSRRLGDAQRRAILRDYADESIPIVGPGGILERHQIPSSVLYRVLADARVPRRRPRRGRTPPGA